MLKVKSLSEINIRWLIGNGDIHAFKDKWLTEVVNSTDLDMKVYEFFNSDGSPNADIKLEVFWTWLPIRK